MARVPKPLIGLLLATIAFFAIWTVALKPHSSGSEGGAGQYQSAIDQAHQAVRTSNQANAAAGAPTATAPAPKPATPAKAAPASAAKPRAKPAPAAKKTASDTTSAASGVQIIQNAIRSGKVTAVLFYNPAAADDQAMRQELAAVPAHGGKVVKLAVPVAQLTQFGFITQQVQVDTAPTLVVIDAVHHATTITGYADGVEIAQRVADAVATK